MPSEGFLPFLELSKVEGAIAATAWTLDGDAVGNGAIVPGWGYGLPLAFRRTVVLNPARIRQECQLRAESILRVVCAWSAQSAVNLGKSAASIDLALSGDERLEHDLTMEVPSPSIAETLTLRTVVVLHGGLVATSPLAARLPGSILWKDSTMLVLEGRTARMPILAADFSTFNSAEQNAAWFVWTGPDWLQRDPTAGITVYINAARPALLAALTAKRPDYLQLCLQSVFFHDIGRALIERALDDEDFADDADYNIGSFGNSVLGTLRSLFGPQTIEQIRIFRNSDPAAFGRMIQTRHKLLGDLE